MAAYFLSKIRGHAKSATKLTIAQAIEITNPCNSCVVVFVRRLVIVLKNHLRRLFSIVIFLS